MRRYVRPADPGATIPDPERGDALPPDGREVTWSAHWAVMLAREEISADPPRNEAPPEPAPAPAAPPAAGVPFLITKAQRAALRARGLDQATIAALTPSEAQALLADPSPAA